MVILYGVSVYVTLANISFFFSALSTDLLWLRFYLLSAYVCLLLAGIMNYPTWPQWGRVGAQTILLGAIIWPCVVGLFHLHGFLSLCWDERRVKLRTEDDEQVWRLMFRRGGMQRLEFKHAHKLGRWKCYKAGEVIYDTEDPKTIDLATSLHLLVEGIGVLSIKREFEETAESMLYSGYFFDLAIFNALGVYVGLERAAIMTATAQTDCLLFVWDLEAVEKMAGEDYPALAAAWRNLALYSVGSAFSSTCGDYYASNGQEEDPAVFEFGARSRDMVIPLSEQEEQPFNFWEWLKWFILMHNPIPPVGLRHTSMPTSGMLAQGRWQAANFSVKFERSKPSRSVRFGSRPSFSQLRQSSSEV